MKFFNDLTPAEFERLALLSEECGEVVQAIGKIFRHGYESNHPDSCETNRIDLETEIGHVFAALELMTDKDVSYQAITESKALKLVSVLRYLHHQEES
jgi:NTP pyrophosphatase (non-canonical NTP hydrolase)